MVSDTPVTLASNVAHTPTVLVVDDEAVICEVIEKFLRSFGYKIVPFTEPSRAMKYLVSNSVDLVLTDLQMGSISGVDILRATQKHQPDAIVVLITGYPTVENAVQVLKEGAYDYITKPFRLDELGKVVQRGLEQQRLSREVVLLKETVSLYRISEAMNSSLELPQVLQMILNTAVRESKSNSGCVILVDERNERLVAGASKGELPEDFDHLNSLPPQAVRDWIHFHENMQGPVQVGAGQDPARNVYHRLLEQSPGCELFCRALFQSASALSIPLKAKDRVIGALTLMRNQNAGDYQSRAIKGLIILASNAARAIENARLHNNLRSDYLNIIKALSNAVEAKDPYTRGHSDRVVRYTQAIGGALGLPVSDLEKLEVASILHDIGKIGISDQILLKPAGLSDDEYDLMKQHPIIGDRILQPINSLDEVRLWVYQHHERHDGLGYPEGLKGDNIEFQARILIVAEVFDALVTERAYKKAWPLPTVIDYLGDHASSHFDPDVVKIFCEILSKDGDDFAAYSQSNSFKLLSPDDLIQFFKDRP